MRSHPFRNLFFIFFVLLILQLFISTLCSSKVGAASAPEITGLSRENIRLDGGEEVVITGRNFSPESVVLLDGRVINSAVVESTKTIRFRTPRMNAPGFKALLVLTNSGKVQRELSVISTPL